MKKIFVIIIVIFTCIKGVHAQDLYRATVKNYVENNILMFEQQINSITKPLSYITKEVLTNYDESRICPLPQGNPPPTVGAGGMRLI